MDSSKRPISETSLLLLLAAVQFTHVMDFMVMMPLGPQLMRELDISPRQFGALISSFAITAGVVGLAVAPFIDRFDRRHLLLVAYAGFTVAALACGISDRWEVLLIARAVCGAFGGISGATIMAIAADVVPAERRARGMAVIMTAFSVAAALGVPFGLKLAQGWRWEAPFLVVAGLAASVWALLFKCLPPVRGHLCGDGLVRSGRDFWLLLRDWNAWRGLALMVAVVFGHFTIIPFLSPFLVGNMGMREESLFLVYVVGGVVTVFSGPLVGRLADRYGKFFIYAMLVCGACVVIWQLTSSGRRPEWHVLVMAGFFFMLASGRFIPTQAVISLAVPAARRGAYMSLVACARDLASGLTTSMGGWVVVEVDGRLLGYDRLGIVAICVSIGSLWVFRQVKVVKGS